MVEPGEECDCGPEIECDFIDPSCNPPKNEVIQCKLKRTSVCDKDDGNLSLYVNNILIIIFKLHSLLHRLLSPYFK